MDHNLHHHHYLKSPSPCWSRPDLLGADQVDHRLPAPLLEELRILVFAERLVFNALPPLYMYVMVLRQKWPYTAHRAVVRSVSSYYWCMVLHGIAWYCIVLHGIAWIAWYCIVLHGIAWYCMTLRGIAWNCMVLYGIARVCQSMQEYARVCQSIPEYAKVCQSKP